MDWEHHLVVIDCVTDDVLIGLHCTAELVRLAFAGVHKVSGYI